MFSKSMSAKKLYIKLILTQLGSNIMTIIVCFSLMLFLGNTAGKILAQTILILLYLAIPIYESYRAGNVSGKENKPYTGLIAGLSASTFPILMCIIYNVNNTFINIDLINRIYSIVNMHMFIVTASESFTKNPIYSVLIILPLFLSCIGAYYLGMKRIDFSKIIYRKSN